MLEAKNKRTKKKVLEIFGSGLSHTKKERIHGEVHTEYVLNPFSGQREPWYFIDGIHVDSETLIIEK